jgi:hypothetical protein
VASEALRLKCGLRRPSKSCRNYSVFVIISTIIAYFSSFLYVPAYLQLLICLKQVNQKWIKEGIVFVVTDSSNLLNRNGEHSAEFIKIRDFLKSQESILRNSRWN